MCSNRRNQRLIFQSTPSARRTAQESSPRFNVSGNFNPRPPRGGRRSSPVGIANVRRFQSTPSARRTAVNVSNMASPDFTISIHALREEDGFPGLCRRPKLPADFNPRPPRGGRLQDGAPRLTIKYFNPRPPRGGRLRRLLPVSRPLGNFNPRPPRGGRQSLPPE